MVEKVGAKPHMALTVFIRFRVWGVECHPILNFSLDD
jgi:hypothetical protein